MLKFSKRPPGNRLQLWIWLIGASAMWLHVGACGAPVEADANELKATLLAESAASNRVEVPKLNPWKRLSISQGIARRHYREPDPLSRVDPLDSETGSVPTTEIDLRWRGQLAQALPDLVLQAQARYTHGQTAYSGYLQQGSILTPFTARTGNTLQALSLRVGLPLNALTRLPWAQHIAPYAEQSWHRWQRNLTQYGETFTGQTTTLGVMALWPLAELGLPQFARFTLEADFAVGRSRSLHINAPSLDFATDLPNTEDRSAALGLQYAVTPTWLIGLRYAAHRSSYGASPTVAGLQYPGSHTTRTSWVANLGYHF